MTLTVVQCSFESMQPRWSELARSLDATPFTSPEFHQAWWSTFAAESSLEREIVALQRDSGALVGLAPLKRCGSHWSFAGDHEVSDYLGPIAAPGHEADLVTAILDLLDASDALSADFRGLEPGSEWESLLTQATDRGWSVTAADEAVCPIVEVSEGWDGYLSALRSRDRREVRRKLRPLRQLRGAVRFEALTTPDAIAAHMPRFMDMMAESRGDKAVFLTDQMRSFFERLSSSLAEIERVRLYHLSIADESAAMVFCFVARNQLLLYNSGYAARFRDLSVGLASKVLCIRDAVEEGMTSVNFLRGDEPYKYELGGVNAVVRHVQLQRTSA